MNQSHIRKQKIDEEHSQSIARLVIVTCVTLLLSIFLFLGKAELNSLALSVAYLLFSLFWLLLVRTHPGEYTTRRLVTMLTDIGLTTIAMLLMQSYGAALYPFYLWIIVGYGMRFGAKWLLLAMLLGASGFSAVLAFSNYWHQNIPSGIGLLIGLIILPTFYLVLIKRLHLLNAKLEQELKKTSYAATHDGLTDLANRDYFFQTIEHEMEKADRYSDKFAMLFVDLDGFKEINDTLGHVCGDQTLKIVAQRLRAQCRKSDMVARLGGDEFGILLYKAKKPEDIKTFSQKVIQQLSLPMDMPTQQVFITASIGISIYPNHGKSPDELINNADHAMYKSKKKGKNSYTFYLDEIA